MKVARGGIQLFIGIVSCVLVLGACTSAPTATKTTTTGGGSGVGSGAATPTGYLFDNGNEAAFIAWTQSGDNLSGTLQIAYVDASGSSVQTDNLSLTGLLNQGNVTLTLDKSVLNTANLSGTFNGSVLVLSIPNNDGTLGQETFDPGSVTSYNSDVAALQRKAGQAQTAQQAAAAAASRAAQQEKNRATVSNDVGAIESGISNLSQNGNASSDLAAVANALSITSTDLGKTETGASNVEAEAQQYPGGNNGQVCADASGVAADASGVSADAGGVEAYSGAVELDIGSIRGDITGLNNAVAQLQADESSTGITAGDAPSQSSVSQAIATAQATISQYLSMTNGQISQASNDVTAAIQASDEASQAGSCNFGSPSSPAQMNPIT